MTYCRLLILASALLTASQAVHSDVSTVNAASLQISVAPVIGRDSQIPTIDSDQTQSEDSAAANELAKLAELRKLFLQAEIAVRNRNKHQYQTLADKLKDYPLYPNLQYQWLRRNMGDKQQVKQFLHAHSGTRYARILKKKWLYRLGKKRQWQDFLQVYTPTRDTSLQCYYQRARYSTSNNADDKQLALDAALDLWTVGRSQPKACDPLFTVLKNRKLITQQHKWQRFDAALRNNKTRLARYIKRQMPSAEQTTANLWLKLHRHPERHLPELLNTAHTQAPKMFAHAIHRLARNDIYQAINVWDQYKDLFAIEDNANNRLDRRLAFKLAHKNGDDAYQRLGTLDNVDTRSQTRRIRLALSQQDWPLVIQAINELDDDTRELEKWQYWLARAYGETGRPVQADELLSMLAIKRDFYGYLAAEMLNQDYQLSHQPLDVTAEHIDSISQRMSFRTAFELMVLNREDQAKLQWWHAVHQLQDSEIPAAAKLAQRWLWDEIAIFTIAKVQLWDDVELRFPLSYTDEIQAQAELHDLDPVILFGLIRRESAFNDDAVSPAGARGLMQIMPGTGRVIARELNERWRGTRSLSEADKNLRYGSYYYQKLLNQFNGHYALALAAYNAGPNRVKKWLPEATLPADIWIETIPYKETRDYVTSVLVYAMIYQQRIHSDELSMEDFTDDVQPLSDIALN